MLERKKAVLASCCSVHAIQDGLGTILVVLLPILAQSFGLGYSQIGVIRATSSALMTIFELPSGVLAERFGERILLVLGLCASGFGCFLLAGAGGYLSILLALSVIGFGAAFQHALCSSLVTAAFVSNHSRTALGVYNTSGDVGKLAFSGGFLLLIGAGAAWQGVIACLGVLLLAFAVAVLVVLRRSAAGARPPPPVRTESERALGWGVRNRSGFSALVAIVFFDIAVQGGFLTFLAFLMIEKQVPTSLSAAAVVVTLAGGVFGKLGCGWLADRFGTLRSLAVVELLTALGIIAVMLSPALLAFCLLPIVGVVLQGSSSITYATVGDLIHGERHSRGFALVYSISGAAGIIGPIAFGFVGDRFGLSTSMLMMAAVTLLPIPLSLMLGPALKTSASVPAS